jgi:hypothetical protein
MSGVGCIKEIFKLSIPLPVHVPMPEVNLNEGAQPVS